MDVSMIEGYRQEMLIEERYRGLATYRIQSDP